METAYLCLGFLWVYAFPCPHALNWRNDLDGPVTGYLRGNCSLWTRPSLLLSAFAEQGGAYALMVGGGHFSWFSFSWLHWEFYTHFPRIAIDRFHTVLALSVGTLYYRLCSQNDLLESFELSECKLTLPCWTNSDIVVNIGESPT